MRLEIRNIGKVRHADIAIDGITVIAAANNTGKSTLGKALYPCCHRSIIMIPMCAIG